MRTPNTETAEHLARVILIILAIVSLAGCVDQHTEARKALQDAMTEQETLLEETRALLDQKEELQRENAALAEKLAIMKEAR